MVATSVRCAIISSCKGQGSFSSTSGFVASKGISEPEWRKRNCTIEAIGIRPNGSSNSSRGQLSLPQRSGRIQLSQTFVRPKKQVIVFYQASNPRIIASKQVAFKGSHDREPSKSSGEVQNNGKSDTGRTNSPASSSKGTAAIRQVVVKDGLAGLAVLKTQLENERPRISRVNLNDVSGQLLKQRKQAELRKRQEAIKSSTSSKSEVSRETSPSKVSSSNGPIREGDTALICITNLAKKVTKEEYEFIMQSIPGITSWKYLTDRGGQCLGYGFCEAQSESDIEAILQHLSEQVLHGKKIKVSLAERSGNEYKQSLERRSRMVVSSKGARKDAPIGASSSSSVKDIVRKGNASLKNQAGLRDVWKSQPSSSQEFRAPQDGSPKENLKNRKAKIGSEQMFTTSVIERDAGDTISSTGVDSSQGTDDESATKLTGQSVFEALQRVGALQDSRSKRRKRKGGSGGGNYSSDSDSDDDTKQGPLPPLVFKLEWAKKIEELENDLKELRR